MRSATDNIEQGGAAERTSLIPVIDSPIFEGHDNTSYYVGIISALGDATLQTELQGAKQLRARVYIDERAFLDPSHRREDGTETDQNDDRSCHHVVAERVNERQVRLVGNVRAINKRHEQDLLPAEHIFPSVFEEMAAPVGSIEASRFIARHEVRAQQRAISLSLMRAIFVQAAFGCGNKPMFAIVEDPFYKSLLAAGVPLRVVHEKIKVSEYGGTENMLLQFNPLEVVDTAKDESNSTPIAMHMRASQAPVGYYDQTLLEPKDE